VPFALLWAPGLACGDGHAGLTFLWGGLLSPRSSTPAPTPPAFGDPSAASDALTARALARSLLSPVRCWHGWIARRYLALRLGLAALTVFFRWRPPQDAAAGAGACAEQRALVLVRWGLGGQQRLHLSRMATRLAALPKLLRRSLSTCTRPSHAGDPTLSALAERNRRAGTAAIPPAVAPGTLEHTTPPWFAYVSEEAHEVGRAIPPWR